MSEAEVKENLNRRYRQASNKEKLAMCQDLQAIKTIQLLKESRSGDFQKQCKIAIT